MQLSISQVFQVQEPQRELTNQSTTLRSLTVRKPVTIPNIHHGHVLPVLRTIPDRSIQCCITSPPYWFLRNYQTDPQIWASEHPPCSGRHEWTMDNFCKWCNAWRGELGNEPTPDLYIRHIVEIFREVKRVLRPDGTLWLNLGDSYSKINLPNDSALKPKFPSGFNLPGLKRKDLVGIPWAAAFALRDDGWYLRSDVIWYKTNVMPESVKNRPTKTHEYIFLLTRSEEYYYDADAIREPHLPQSLKRGARHFVDHRMDGIETPKRTVMECHPLGRNKRTVWMISTAGFKGAHHAAFPEQIPEICIKASTKPGDPILDPFAGTGTSGAVAVRLRRKPVLIELRKKYINTIIRPRLTAEANRLC